jgi:glycosyltransferase involved in cell wall biosynthesis
MALFSIGLPTYRRPEALRRAIQALLAQTFADFEVIVGNDDPAGPLDAASLGIHDPRVRFVNHVENLGEAGNMNALLALAKGRYFTWQFDDDLVHSRFLEEAHRILRKHPDVPVVFTAFREIERDEVPELPPVSREAEILAGRVFLREYFSSKRKAMGCTGVYETETLRRMGGMVCLCNAKAAVYGEYLLILEAGTLGKVAYVDLPLVFFRVHPGSWSSAHGTSAMLLEAGANLLNRGTPLLAGEPLRADFPENFRALLALAFGGVVGRLHHEHGRFPLWAVLRSLRTLRAAVPSCEGVPAHEVGRAFFRQRVESWRIAACEALRSLGRRKGETA